MKRFDHLDTLRFFLAFYVVFGHSVGWVWFAKSGGLAVDFFFILSGFVLAQSISVKRMGWQEFALRRFARMWPINFASMLAVIAIVGTAVPDVELFANLFLLQNSGMLHALTLNWPAWSVSAEFVVGLLILWPIVYYRSLIGATAIIIFGFTLLMPIQVPLDHMHIEPIGPTTAGIFRCAVGSSLGFIVYEFHKYFSNNSLSKWKSFAIHVSAIFTIVFFLGSDVNNSWKAIAIITSAAAIFSLATFSSSVTDTLANKKIAWLGSLSFGIYMWHAPMLLFFMKIDVLPASPETLARIQSGDNSVLFPLICFFASVVVFAMLSYRYLERPSQKYITALFSKNHKDAVVESEAIQVSNDVEYFSVKSDNSLITVIDQGRTAIPAQTNI